MTETAERPICEGCECQLEDDEISDPRRVGGHTYLCYDCQSEILYDYCEICNETYDKEFEARFFACFFEEADDLATGIYRILDPAMDIYSYYERMGGWGKRCERMSNLPVGLDCQHLNCLVMILCPNCEERYCTEFVTA